MVRRLTLSGTSVEWQPVRPKPLVTTVVLALGTLVAAGAALADGDDPGLGPESPASPGADRIADTYWVITAFMGLVFLAVFVPLVWFMVRYRRRGRPRFQDGSQVSGSMRLELTWTLVPVGIAAILIGFVVLALPSLNDFAKGFGGENEEITVVGKRFYWNYEYPNGVLAVDRLRLPLGRNVELDVTGGENDVIHSFWVPALGGKFDSIPGQTNTFHIVPTKRGTFEGVCGEFCGLEHTEMSITVEVLAASEYDRWLRAEADRQEAGSSGLGQQTFEGACAKCHGLAGEGDVGPRIAGSALLDDREALTRLLEQGRGKMPAVGAGWEQRQYDALFDYLDAELGGGGGDGS